MKIKTLVCSALAALIVLCSGGDLAAQKRSTGKKKTTARTTSKTIKTPSAPSISADFLLDNKFYIYQQVGNSKQNATTFMYASVKFEKNNEISLDYGFHELGGTWSVRGNKVTIKSGSLTYTLTSKDGGNTFTGTQTDSAKGSETTKLNMYNGGCRNIPDAKDKESWLQALKNNEYTVWLRYYIIKEKMFFGNPVKVKFVEDEEDPYQGTVKISGDGALMEFLGDLKSEYNFGEKGLTIHFKGDTLDEKSSRGYSDTCNGYFSFKLGNRQFPGYGNVVVYLDFFHK